MDEPRKLHFRTPGRRFGFAFAAVMAGVAVVLLASTAGASAKGPGSDHAKLDRVFIIMLENHSKQSVIGDPNTPYITSLAETYAQATNYYGVTHPSEPNYIAATSGSNWYTNNDNPANVFDHTNIVDELNGNGISWAAYMQAMPSAGYTGQFWPSSADPLYANKHNPFVLYSDILASSSELAHIKPYTSLAHDLSEPDAPKYVWVTPDQCNDMHGGIYDTIPGYSETPCPYNTTNDDPADVQLKKNADAFVHQTVTTIMSSKAWTPHSAIVIVSDEGDYTGNTANGGWDSPAGCCDSPVLPAGIDPSGPHHFTSSTAYNHYSLLRTIEDAWGLPEIGYTSDHAQVPTMNAFLSH